ncbi:MAG: glycoside hydrolase family 2 protein, partial [Verrucomicrobiae bacterium]|nr:glycoside hydrolase family 2 protein [Verrucomicrobiae bacterium]
MVFEGLDTIAELRLNGRLLGRAANMFRTHRFDVAGKFRPRGNVLEVRFASPTKWAKAREKRDGVFVQANGVDFRQHLRKAACHYGWDWGLRLATSGIWRRARLELGDGRGIGDWTLRTIGIGKGRATLEWTGRVRADAKGRGNWRWRIRARCGSHRWRSEARGAAFKKRLAVRAPRLWQPRGEGDANLYEVTLELLDGERLVDRKRFEFGVRTVRFDQTKDLHGVSFRCVVNGRPVWLRGANWVPVDSLIPRDEERRARELLDRAAEAGMNCVRVWGGGVYESDEFYSHCDRLGMLVWQD